MSSLDAINREALRRLSKRSVMFLSALVPWIMPIEGKVDSGLYIAPSPRLGEAGMIHVDLETGFWVDRLGSIQGQVVASGDDVISLIAYRDETNYVDAAETLVVILTDDTAMASF